MSAIAFANGMLIARADDWMMFIPADQVHVIKAHEVEAEAEDEPSSWTLDIQHAGGAMTVTNVKAEDVSSLPMLLRAARMQLTKPDAALEVAA